MLGAAFRSSPFVLPEANGYTAAHEGYSNVSMGVSCAHRGTLESASNPNSERCCPKAKII